MRICLPSSSLLSRLRPPPVTRRHSAASAPAPRVWAARSWPSQMTRAPSTGTRLASRPGATFDFQVSTGEGLDGLRRRGLPVLGPSYYRTSQAAGFTTVSASVTDKTGDRERCTIRHFTTSNFGATVVQTIVSRAGYRNNGEAGQRLESRRFDPRTTVDFDAGAMVSVGSSGSA